MSLLSLNADIIITQCQGWQHSTLGMRKNARINLSDWNEFPQES